MREVMAALKVEEKRLSRELAGVRAVIARAERATAAASGKKAKRGRRTTRKAAATKGPETSAAPASAPAAKRTGASKASARGPIGRKVVGRGTAATPRGVQSRTSALLAATEAGNG